MQTENLKLKLYEENDVLNILSDVNTLINSLDIAVGNLVNIMTKVESDTTSNTSAVEVLEGALALTNKMLNEVESAGTSTDVRLNDAITENVNKISVLTTQLDALKTSSDSSIEEIHGNVSQLDGRLTVLNNAVTTLSTSVDTKNNQQDMRIAGNSSNITTLTGRISTNEDAIQMLESDIQELNNNAESIESNISNVSAKVTALENKTATLTFHKTPVFAFYGSNYTNDAGDSGDILEEWDENGTKLNNQYVYQFVFAVSSNKPIIPIGIFTNQDEGITPQENGYGTKNVNMNNNYTVKNVEYYNGAYRCLVNVTPIGGRTDIFGENIYMCYLTVD